MFINKNAQQLLEYCISAWSPHYVKDKELLERIQHRFTRMIPELRNLPYLQRLEELKLWTLEERRTRADLIEVYKIIRGISSVSFDTFFEFHQYGQTRGHSFKLMKKRASTELRHHFFSERVINTWNSLDDRTVMSESLNIFKRNLERVRQCRGIGLFIGSWCFLTYRGWAVSAGEASSGKFSKSLICMMPIHHRPSRSS